MEGKRDNWTGPLQRILTENKFEMQQEMVDIWEGVSLQC